MPAKVECSVKMRNSQQRGAPVTQCTNTPVAVVRQGGKEHLVCKRHKTAGVFVRNL